MDVVLPLVPVYILKFLISLPTYMLYSISALCFCPMFQQIKTLKSKTMHTLLNTGVSFFIQILFFFIIILHMEIPRRLIVHRCLFYIVRYLSTNVNNRNLNDFCVTSRPPFFILFLFLVSIDI